MSSIASTSPVADFRVSVEEQLLRDSMREMAVAHWSAAQARATLEDPAPAASAWPRLAEWVGVVETGAVATCIAAEEAGAALLPGELLGAWAFAGLLAALEHPLAPDAVAGELPGAVAYAPGDGRLVLPGPGDGPVLSVTEGPIALTGPGALTAIATADLTRRFATVEVPPDAERLEPADPVALAAWAGTVALAAGADGLGACRTLLATTVEYAGSRKQFGRPIGTFQAVRHRLVDLALALERATASTYFAAMLVDAGDPDADRAVHAARASAGDAIARFTRGAVQLHGAIGYTWEHDVHLYVRRAYVSDRLFGSGGWRRARLAAAILEPVDARERGEER